MPLVSIVVPVFNIKEYISECVVSILEQSHDDLEVVLVDDGSTDGSGELCLDWAAKDIRIRVLQQDNGGVSSARNLGLRNATGELVTFVDGDNIIHHKMVASLVCALEVNDEIDVAVCSKEDFRFDFDRYEDTPGNSTRVISGNFVTVELLYQRIVNGPFGKMIRRPILEDFSFPEGVRIGEDLLANLSIFAQARFVTCMSGTFYGYRLRAGSATKKSTYDDRVALVERLERDMILQDDPRTVRAFKTRIFAEGMYCAISSPQSFHRKNPNSRGNLVELLRRNRFDIITNPNALRMHRVFAVCSIVSPLFAGQVIAILHRMKVSKL